MVAAAVAPSVDVAEHVDVTNDTHEVNTSIFKSPYGNTIFAAVSGSIFFFLTIVVFMKDLFPVCSKPFLSPQPIESTSIQDDKENEPDGISKNGNAENILLKVAH